MRVKTAKPLFGVADDIVILNNGRVDALSTAATPAGQSQERQRQPGVF